MDLLMRWRILCYHAIEPPLRKDFGRQLDAFAKRGWNFRSLSEGIKELGAHPGGGGEQQITVTFDDGDHTVCAVAQPELDARGIKAMLYLTTDYVVQGTIYHTSPPRPSVTWDQLGRWLEAGNEIGSHTHSHCNLAECLPERIAEETDRSRALIKEMLGVDAVHLSYPWGQHDAATRRYFVESSAWRSAATIDRGWNRPGTSPYALRRDLIEPHWSRARTSVVMKLADHDRLYAAQRRLRGLRLSS